MKSMSRRLSLKAGKSSKSGKASKSSKGKASLADAVPNYVWQGEEVSALDGLLGGEHASANVHDDRRYVRQKVVGSADMLTPAVVPKDERSPRQLHRIVDDIGTPVSSSPHALVHRPLSLCSADDSIGLHSATASEFDSQVSVSESPAPSSTLTYDSQHVQNLLAQVDEKTLEISKLQEQFQSLEKESLTKQEEASAEIEQLKEAVQTVKARLEASERTQHEYEQRNQQLLQEKAEWRTAQTARLNLLSVSSTIHHEVPEHIECAKPETFSEEPPTPTNSQAQRMQLTSITSSSQQDDSLQVQDLRAQLEEKMSEIGMLRNRFVTLEEENKAQREDTESKISRLEANVRDTKAELEESVQLHMQYKQQGDLLLKEKAEWMVERTALLESRGSERQSESVLETPAPVSPTDNSPDLHLLAQTEKDALEITRLSELCQFLEEEYNGKQEQAIAELSRLKEAVKDANIERQQAEQMHQRCQQQNQQLVREKAEWVAGKSTRRLSSSSSPDASATTTLSVRNKQLETLLQFVSSQLPAIPDAGERRASPDGVDLTRIRQQVLSARQELITNGDISAAMSELKKQLQLVQGKLDAAIHAKEETVSRLQLQQTQHEKLLLLKTSDLSSLQTKYSEVCMERDQLESRVVELNSRRKSSSSEPLPEDKQQVLALRQEKAQLRLELRRAQKEVKDQKQAIAELSSENATMKSLLSSSEAKAEGNTSAACEECIKISAENHRLHSELDGLRDEHLVKMAELRQLEAERNSLREVNTLTSRNSDRYRSDLETLHARHSALTEDYENTSSELMSLSAQLDALRKSHQLAANESLHEEKQALEHKLQELQEQLCDRGTMVREIKQRNEILYDKLQKETKQVRELADSNESLMKMLSKKEAELTEARDEYRDINAVIDQMEELPRSNERLREENRALCDEIKELTTNRFDVSDANHMQREELDQAFRQMEWRLMVLEPKQDQWRKDKEELDHLRESEKRLKSLVAEASQELTTLRLHNQQIPLLQDQFKSKAKEVSYHEQECRQLQQELREVELEVAVLKEKTRRSQVERQNVIEHQRMQAQAQEEQNVDHYNSLIQNLQQKLSKKEDESSLLISRTMDAVQRQQRLATEVEQLKANARALEEEKAVLQDSLDNASRVAKDNGISSSMALSSSSSQTCNGVGRNQHAGSPSSLAESDKQLVSDENGSVPKGYDLMNDFSGTESVDEAIVELCRGQTNDPPSDNDELYLRQYWFQIINKSSSSVATQCLGQFLHLLMSCSEELVRLVVNFVDGSGNSALHYLVLRGQLTAVWLLLQTGQCRVDTKNAGGYTCSMMASVPKPELIAPHTFVLKKLFQLADINLQAEQDGQTALMLAVGKQNIQVIDLLLQANCDVNTQDMDGSTALMFASEHGHEEIVRKLLSHEGCDIDIKDTDDSTALSIAVKKGRREVVILLFAASVYNKAKRPKK